MRIIHKTIATADVDVLTLDDLLADGKIEKMQYLKIDIEGAELEVLAGGTRALEHCQAIKVEVSFLPQRVGQALAHEVAALLDARDSPWRTSAIPIIGAGVHCLPTLISSASMSPIRAAV